LIFSISLLALKNRKNLLYHKEFPDASIEERLFHNGSGATRSVFRHEGSKTRRNTKRR